MSQVYFLEFFVYDLHLDDQIVRDAGEAAVVVIKINFIDLPTFEITRQNVSSARVNTPRVKTRLDFEAGYACQFTLQPEKLVQKILKFPLAIKIFREGDSFPLCLAELPLSGCLCDQAKSLGNLHLPKPYVFGGSIGLVDIGENPSGNVNMKLRLTSNGNHLITSYVLENDCFLFKNDPRGPEFKVKRMQKDEETEESTNEIREELDDQTNGFGWENYMLDVAGIFPIAGPLSLGKPPPKARRVPLGQGAYLEEQEPGENREIKREPKTVKNRKEKK